MGTFSIWHIAIVVVIALLLFGRPGRIANLMKDFGEGIKGFRKGLSDEPAQPPPQDPPRQVPDQTTQREPARTNEDREH